MTTTFRFPNLRAFISIVLKAASGWASDNASSMGAALAYYTLFSVAPILIIALAIAGYVVGPQAAQTQVLSQLPALIGGSGTDAVHNLLQSAHYSDHKGLAAIVGIITLIVGATSVFGELQYALERIWKTPEPPHTAAWWRLLRGRIFSLGMVIGTGFLLLVSLIASALISALSSWISGFLPPVVPMLAILDFVLSFGMTVVLFAAIFKYAPREQIPWGDVWVGATVTAFLFTVGKSLIGIYLGKSSFTSAYGAAGSLIVLLLWIYYSAQIFLFGAEFTCAFAYERGSRIGGHPNESA